VVNRVAAVGPPACVVEGFWKKRNNLGDFSCAGCDEMREGCNALQMDVPRVASFAFIFSGIVKSRLQLAGWNRRAENSVLFSEDVEADDAN
jgi:hypothetical protein